MVIGFVSRTSSITLSKLISTSPRCWDLSVDVVPWAFSTKVGEVMERGGHLHWSGGHSSLAMLYVRPLSAVVSFCGYWDAANWFIAWSGGCIMPAVVMTGASPCICGWPNRGGFTGLASKCMFPAVEKPAPYRVGFSPWGPQLGHQLLQKEQLRVKRAQVLGGEMETH